MTLGKIRIGTDRRQDEIVALLTEIRDLLRGGVRREIEILYGNPEAAQPQGVIHHPDTSGGGDK